jgi:hypothetical protein
VPLGAQALHLRDQRGHGDEARPAEDEATVAALATLGGIPATWARLRDGSWGVRVTREVKVGDVVTVTSQSGKVQDKAITGIAFKGQGYTLCYV